MPRTPRLVLIDGNSLLFRGHFAFGEHALRDSKGRETSGVLAFVNMVQSVLSGEGPEYVAVAFDKGRDTFRRRKYAAYKAHREETPQELRDQIPFAHRFVEAMGFPRLESSEFEADDLLGTMARRFGSDDLHVIIVTGDRDLLQMVDERTTVRLTHRGVREVVDYTPERVRKDFQVPPGRLVELKGLTGDASDNIPGVPKVGPKTALKLILEHGTLEGVYESLGSIKGALRESLEKNRDLAFLSRELGTIRVDADADVDLERCRVRSPDVLALRQLYLELDFHRLAADLDVPTDSAECEYVAVRTIEDLDRLVTELETAEWISLDTETTSEFPVRADLVGISLATRPRRGSYIPLGHHSLDAGVQLPPALVLSRLEPVLAKRKVCGQNLKYDDIVLTRHGLELAHVDFDTMIASYLINPTRRKHGLDDLSLEFLGRKLIGYQDVVSKGQDFRDVSVDVATRYAGEDAESAYALMETFRPRLEEAGLMPLFEQIEMPLMRILARMEAHGVQVEVGYLEALGRELGQDIQDAERKVHELAGETFHIGSPIQLGRILFEKLGLPVLKKTKTGHSTDQDVLLALEVDHGAEIASWINRHRRLSKLRSTYVEGLLKLVDRATGRVHTSWNQTVAATGRLSSSDPNLQNIPTRTADGLRIRRAFRASPGMLLVGFDYSQIELRILAHLTGSPFLREAFAAGRDVHRMTAARIFGIPEEEVDRSRRDRAKAINFGILYGMSAFGLSRETGISQAQAKTFIEGYFGQFPEVKRAIDETLARTRRDGYTSTLLGRRRYIPEIHSRNGQERAFAERIAVNTPIQGSAADLIKKAMVELDPVLRSEFPGTHLLLQIHDELILEVPAADRERLEGRVRQVMEGALQLDVPIEVNVASGSSWADLK